MADVHPIAVAYQRMVAGNTLDAAVPLIRRDWRPRPTPLAHALLQDRRRPAPTWLQRQLAGA